MTQHSHKLYDSTLPQMLEGQYLSIETKIELNVNKEGSIVKFSSEVILILFSLTCLLNTPSIEK